MSPHPMRSRMTAFTLVELMIVVALVAVILALAAPSFRDMILMQRLRGVNAQIVTDMQYARSEAISRGTYVHVKFQGPTAPGDMACYIIFTRITIAPTPDCDCKLPEGARCGGPALREVRTVQVKNDQSVLLRVPTGPSDFVIDPRTGGITMSDVDVLFPPSGNVIVDTYIDDARRFRNQINQSGRPSVCRPPGSSLAGGTC